MNDAEIAKLNRCQLIFFVRIFNKRGFTIGDLGTTAIAFGFLVIVFTVVGVIAQQIPKQVENVTTSNTEGLEALNTMSSFLPLIMLIAIGGILMGIIFSKISFRDTDVDIDYENNIEDVLNRETDEAVPKLEDYNVQTGKFDKLDKPNYDDAKRGRWFKWK